MEKNTKNQMIDEGWKIYGFRSFESRSAERMFNKQVN